MSSEVGASATPSPLSPQFPIMSATYTYEEKAGLTTLGKRLRAVVARGAPRYLVWGARSEGDAVVRAV